MGDFGDIDDFNEHAVQGKPIRAYKNGHFENSKGASLSLSLFLFLSSHTLTTHTWQTSD